jgi:hypothetical protein
VVGVTATLTLRALSLAEFCTFPQPANPSTNKQIAMIFWFCRTRIPSALATG